MSNTNDILKRPVRNSPTPSEFGFRLNLANRTARTETKRFPPLALDAPLVVSQPESDLDQVLQVGKEATDKALGK